MTLPPLVHYSAKPLGEIKSIAQETEPDHKPRGLWVSCDDNWGWKEWCEQEGFAQDRFTHQTRVELSKSAEILHISIPAEIDAFSAEYIKPTSWGGTFSMHIDWGTVALNYQGIIIAPYQWSRRLFEGSSWYYGWDCSSGCIWDADAIGGIGVHNG